MPCAAYLGMKMFLCKKQLYLSNKTFSYNTFFCLLGGRRYSSVSSIIKLFGNRKNYMKKMKICGLELMQLHSTICVTTDHSGLTVWPNVILLSPLDQTNKTSQAYVARTRKSSSSQTYQNLYSLLIWEQHRNKRENVI